MIEEAKQYYTTGWRRYFPLISYHLVLMMLMTCAIVLLCKFEGPAVGIRHTS